MDKITTYSFPLYAESTYTFDEYTKGVFAVNKRRHFYANIKVSFVISIGVFLITFVSGRPQVGFFLALAVFPALLLLGHAVKSRSLAQKVKKSYDSDESLQEAVIKFKFFSEHVEISDHYNNEGDDVLKTLKFEYDELDKIIRTKTNYYLTSIVEADEATYFLVKENCSKELIDFVQELKKSKLVAIKNW